MYMNLLMDQILFDFSDEELARKLQAEQDHNDSQVLQSPSKRLSGSRRGQPVSLAQLSEQSLVPPPSPLKREPVKPLAEIMEEEMSKQKTREELVNVSWCRRHLENVTAFTVSWC